MQQEESKVILPITPMLDMTFQLLFFFIISFNPADLEGSVDMALPSEPDKAAEKQEDVKKDSQSDPEEIKFESDLTVQVRTQLDGRNDGDISAIFVRDITGKEDLIQPDNTNRPRNPLLAGLKKYLIEKRENLTNQDSIKLQGDGKLKVGNIIRVMDACREAGFTNISFVPPEDFRK
jgi:biopolymer transport protein ExbD